MYLAVALIGQAQCVLENKYKEEKCNYRCNYKYLFRALTEKSAPANLT